MSIRMKNAGQALSDADLHPYSPSCYREGTCLKDCTLFRVTQKTASNTDLYKNLDY